MLWFLIIPLILIIALLLLSLRLRIELSPDRQIVFVGLGRSGPELDLAAKKGTVKIFGIRLKQFDLDRKTEKEKKPEKEAAKEKEEKTKEKRPSTRRRKPTWQEIRQFLPRIASALWNYSTSILKAVVVEEARGRIEAGFDQPDLTGRVFGYYQAVVGMVPALGGRLVYVPDWTGASFSASMRLSLALPLYKLVWRTLVLITRLPLRELVKLAIGKKRGDEDV